MATVVLDTHALLWWTQHPALLSEPATAAIDGATRLAVSAISFWEVALLVRKQRVDLGMPVVSWAEDVCAIQRVEAVPLTARAALLADSLSMHPDPADRFIVATAQLQAAPLVTKDVLLRDLDFIETVW